MKHRGFTLIELLVVVIIIGVLSSLALPKYRSAMDRARAAEVQQLLPALYAARERWIMENGYHWDGMRIKDDSGTVIEPSIRLLDIELPKVGRIDNTGKTFSTKNATYGLGDCHTCGEGHDDDVYATVIFAARGLGGTTLSYGRRGMCCTTIGSGACEKLGFSKCRDDD